MLEKAIQCARNLGRKTLIGSALIGSLALGCKVGVEGPVDVNVGEQNLGTVTGKALIKIPYQDPNGTYTRRGGIDIRLIKSTDDRSALRNTKYKTISNNNGDFLIEVPAGSYNVHGCYKEDYAGTRYWYGSSSATVSRGSSVNIGEIKLNWEIALGCAYF